MVKLLGSVTEVRPVQPWKALVPMLDTPSGIETEIKSELYMKAFEPTLVTLNVL